MAPSMSGGKTKESGTARILGSGTSGMLLSFICLDIRLLCS